MAAEAFTNMGNHLVSDSASTINAADDASTADADENILNMSGPQRRRHDDEGEGSEGLDEDDDDDLESVTSAAADGPGKGEASKPEEEKELPPHACG